MVKLRIRRDALHPFQHQQPARVVAAGFQPGVPRVAARGEARTGLHRRIERAAAAAEDEAHAAARLADSVGGLHRDLAEFVVVATRSAKAAEHGAREVERIADAVHGVQVQFAGIASNADRIERLEHAIFEMRRQLQHLAQLNYRWLFYFLSRAVRPQRLEIDRNLSIGKLFHAASFGNLADVAAVKATERASAGQQILERLRKINEVEGLVPALPTEEECDHLHAAAEQIVSARPW